MGTVTALAVGVISNEFEQILNRPPGCVVETCAGLRRQTHMINDERDLIS